MITTLFRDRHVHLLGIGGAGVSALVPLLQAVGARVSGCDSQASATTRRLASLGVPVAAGHDPAHLDGVDIVVHSAAVRSDHPELERARANGVRVLTRGQCLVQLMLGTRTIAVAGSHGKTSTTWFLGHLCSEAGLDPVVMVGGAVPALGGSGARAGNGGLFIAETDESDGSFAEVEPEIAIVTNLDREHLRHYGSFARLEDAFNAWLRRIPSGGAVVVPGEGLSPRVLDGVRARIVRVAPDAGEVHATRLALGPEGSVMQVSAFGCDAGEVVVPLPGAHMAHNALMAIAAAMLADARVRPGTLATCERVRRRFTVHGQPGGVRVVEDYGHHPTEVRATIAAARLAGGRVHVAFQPHRVTRTADLIDEFAAAFDQAHAVAVLPVYAAGEAAEPGADNATLARLAQERRRDDQPGLVVACGQEQAVAHLGAHAREGDTVLVLGAGDVAQLVEPVLRFFVAGDRGDPGRPSTPAKQEAA